MDPSILLCKRIYKIKAFVVKQNFVEPPPLHFHVYIIYGWPPCNTQLCDKGSLWVTSSTKLDFIRDTQVQCPVSRRLPFKFSSKNWTQLVWNIINFEDRINFQIAPVHTGKRALKSHSTERHKVVGWSV